MTKAMKKALLDKMLNAGNYFFFRPLANELGIKQLSRAETEGIMRAYLNKRPEMKSYYDNSHHNSFFCGLWFAERSMEFQSAADWLKEVNAW